jgi:antitoxin component YwqK of YwqJK toxin-antitoxin module
MLVIGLSCSSESAKNTIKPKEKVIVSKFADGTTEVECDCYINKKASGECIFYYPSGKVRLISEWKDGKEDGEQKAYYETGEVKLISYAKNGIREGKQTEYYLSGKIKSIRTIKNGVSDGEVKLYYKSGHLMEHYFSVKGKAHGKFTIYYDKLGPNNIKAEGFFKDGNELPGTKTYDQNGIFIEKKSP